MRSNILVKLLCSIPIILLFLYLIPFLGVCLVFLRICLYDRSKKISTSFSLIIIAILFMLPKGLEGILNIFKLDITFFDIQSIVQGDMYIKMFGYSKFLFGLGIVFFLLEMIIRSFTGRAVDHSKNFVRSYIEKQEKRDAEIAERNDLIIKQQQEKAKNTHSVRCLRCGSDNLIVGKVGNCKYCREMIEYKE